MVTNKLMAAIMAYGGLKAHVRYFYPSTLEHFPTVPSQGSCPARV